ncbi:inactive hydroxysteroid dehydrogenase-like protein 1 [Oratosquilla oratoria]|uniref:inactive hydroxysteroid dehydrogenase-like protein 1 n=1 Tax=Oratosquilla oratoria TaxID=337810 RepID=UPI003F75D31E
MMSVLAAPSDFTVDSFKMLFDEVSTPLRRLEDILAIIGLLYAGKLTLSALYSIVTGIRAHLWSRLWNKKLVEKYGTWAVVTGSTDGIGKAYAHELAKNGMNIVLISRTQEKLEKVAKEIEEQHKVATAIVRADFSEGRPIYDNIAKSLEDKEIGILVNNVGVMLSQPMPYTEVSDHDNWSHINVNMGSVTSMARIVLPSMVQRGKGAIINVASIASTGPIPYMGIYAASKAFVRYFSVALEEEIQGKGITIQTVIPSYVSTNMTSFSSFVHRPSILIPTAPRFAASALATLGYSSMTTGYWSHGIQAWITDNLPTWFFIGFMKAVNKFIMWDIEKKKAHTER